MSETLQELADVPKDFLRDGTQFLNRCTKRTSTTHFYNSKAQVTPANSPASRQARIHQDLASSGIRLPDYGRDWLCDQIK